LYLEKAPAGIFETEPSTQISGVEAKKGSKDLVPTDVEEPGATLYVKNLDFSTTHIGLTNAFKGFPGFRLAVLKVKPTNSKGEKPSMGFGFVTFESKEMASQAMTAGVVLDGRKLEMKFARQGTAEIKPTTKAPSAGKKIAIKNLGFAVTKKDLRELFGYVFLLPSAHSVECLWLGPMGIFNPYGYPKSLTTRLEDLRSSSLLRRAMPGMRWSR
jgi:multiple RNA-binding domain-containing protein 1